MSSWRGRLALSLLALVTWLGPGGRAEAGLIFDANLNLTGAGAGESAPTEEANFHGNVPLYLDRLPPSVSPAGTSAPPPPSMGSGLVGGQAIYSLSFRELTPEVGEQVYLADERLKPPSFPSRLFRPPR